MIQIGNKLIEVKKQLGHGYFRAWLKIEFHWSERSAQKFMSAARFAASFFEKEELSNLNNFDVSALALLAAKSTPEEAKQKALERAAQGKFVSHKKAKEIINEQKKLNQKYEIKDFNGDIEPTRNVHNQGIGARYTWENLRFRSKEEVEIAEALERAGVLFSPNCKVRLNTPEGRDNEEPDFLVCYNGKLGILEVDGEPWHPASRAVHDHQRDRLFKVHGIRVVEHYDAKRCSEQPDLVVQEFLEILKNA
ncbi:MAG: DUF3102 domain-containing protein [Microcoleus sp. SIO2G3]|nr:DUF3102 domain-containing protein [Microcoleus sp. SIO2G3]